MTALGIALASGMVLTGILTGTLGRFGVIDVPNHRSSHVQPVPRGGGAAILLSVALALTLTSAWTETLAYGAAGALVLGCVGLIDDLRSIPARTRLLLQVAVASACSGAVVLLGEVGGPLVAIGAAILAVVWLTGFVNVYNFMDGANGVAGLTALIAGVWYLSLGPAGGSTALTVGGAALAGASAGFLPWNFPRARVFMGDVGSYSVGFLLGYLALIAFLDTRSFVHALAPVSVLLIDTSVTLARRIARGEPAMTAHRDHAYQRLSPDIGGSPRAGLLISGATIACLAAVMLPVLACLLVWGLVLGGYMCAPRVFARVWPG